jgi:hypothetical protein
MIQFTTGNGGCLSTPAGSGASIQVRTGNGLSHSGVTFAYDGGLIVGNPIVYVSKGPATVNADGIYDSGVLLTCFGVQYAAQGSVDLAQWDAVSPTGEHKLAHAFAEMIKTFDPRDPKQYIAKMLKDGALPGMPSAKDWVHNDLSLGEMVNRLWLATELLASAFATAYKNTGAATPEQPDTK